MVSTDHLWGIVLAGGDGKRLQGIYPQAVWYERPKQYSAIIGKRSMLRHTLDRVERIIPPRRLQIVVARKHRKYLPEVLKEREKKSILLPRKIVNRRQVYILLSRIFIFAIPMQ